MSWPSDCLDLTDWVPELDLMSCAYLVQTSGRSFWQGRNCPVPTPYFMRAQNMYLMPVLCRLPIVPFRPMSFSGGESLRQTALKQTTCGKIILKMAARWPHNKTMWKSRLLEGWKEIKGLTSFCSCPSLLSATQLAISFAKLSWKVYGLLSHWISAFAP